MSVEIRVEDVTFTYPGGVRALDGVTLAIAPGSTIGIVGQNGSGKSTLVRQLNGLLRPGAGRVLVGGIDIAGSHVAEVARTVGLAFQNPDRQIFSGKVRTEVAFGPRNLGLRGTALDDAVAGALAAFDLGDVTDANPYDLGYSRRKLLAIASILAMRTPIVILDEPTTGQDARGVARLQRLVASLAGEGRTVIAISHDMRFVADTFARIVVMQAGRIVLDGTPSDVFAQPNWDVLASTFLEAPLPARVGARLGLGATPTEASLVAALARQPAG